MNLLIVDDHLTNLKLLLVQLESEGHTVFEAHDGVDALALLERQRVDAVISDILMPRMDGYRLCHEIRKHARLHDLPIIIYSSTYTAPEDEKLALEVGADKYLKKPASVATLVAALQEVIAQPYAAPRPDVLLEVEVLKNYNERLVSKLKEKNTKLLAQTEALRLPSAALSAAANAILIANLDGIIVWGNAAFTSLTGYTVAEVVGKNPRDLVKSGQQERAVYEEMWATILAGRVWHGQIVNRRKDGSLYPEEQTITPMRDANGEITHFIAIKQDLSERKKAEQELRESERRFRDMLGNVELLSVMLDHEARITYCNEYLLHLTGWRHEEVIGRNWSELFLPPGINYMKDAFVALLANRPEAWHRENEMLTRSGERRLIRWNNSVLRSGAGDVIGTASIGEDITERKRAEQALARLVAIIEATPHFVATGQLDGLVLYVNPAGLRMLGYEPGQDVSELLVGGGHPDWALKLVLETGIPHAIEHGIWSGESAFLRPDGKEVSVSQIIIAHRGGDGSVEYLSTIARDVTERKRGQEEVRTLNADLERRVAERTLQLALANRAKSAFLATMSHEIRTPLGGMMGMLELLSMSPLGDEQRETLQMARDSARGLLRILNDVLDWSKIEEGKLELAPQATSIAGLLAEVANTYAHVASGNSVTLAQQVDERLSPALMVDPLRLSQVLNNFVSNAIKFSRVGGRVELRVELIGRREDAEEVRISVKDTGIGIDLQAQSRLFQSYGQASADTARMYGGTGLGLAICRRLADLMDGRIDLDSEPDRGSTFSITLTLPLAKAEVVPRQDQPTIASVISAWPLVHGAAAADAPLVLVVDDHPINRKLLARQLGRLGLRVETAQDGKEALPLWRDGRYALVITDCHMPLLDGYELTYAIRTIEADQARARTPIFAWTANALADEIEKCEAAGMDELLVKPTDLGQLQRMLDKWLPTAAEPAPDQPGAPAPQAAAAPPPLDLTRLTEISGEDSAAVRENLLEFRRTNDQDAVQLRQAVAQDDLERVAHASHRMLGSSGMVGAHDLAGACRNVNHASRAGNSETVAEGMQALEREVQRLNAYIYSLAHMSQGGPDALQ